MTTETNTAETGEQVAFAETEYKRLREIILEVERMYEERCCVVPALRKAEIHCREILEDKLNGFDYIGEEILTSSGFGVVFTGARFYLEGDIAGSGYRGRVAWSENFTTHGGFKQGFCEVAPLVARLALNLFEFADQRFDPEDGFGDSMVQIYLFEEFSTTLPIGIDDFRLTKDEKDWLWGFSIFAKPR